MRVKIYECGDSGVTVRDMVRDRLALSLRVTGEVPPVCFFQASHKESCVSHADAIDRGRRRTGRRWAGGAEQSSRARPTRT